MKKIITLLLALVLTFSLVACGNNKEENNTTPETKAEKATESKTEETKEEITLKVGLTGSESRVWSLIADRVKEKGINLELKFFDSYPLPNAALNAGEIDLNAFQHYIYLNKEIEQLGYEISVVGETVYAPIGLYSKQIKNVSELKDGDKITIPDDPTNGGRALKLLEANGLIKLNPEAGVLPTLVDITENTKNLEIIELAATNIPPTLDEVAAAVINSGVASDAGLKPQLDAIVLEKAGEVDNPYVNVIATRTADKDKPWVQTILDAYYTQEVLDIITEDSKGNSFPVWTPKN